MIEFENPTHIITATMTNIDTHTYHIYYFALYYLILINFQ